jgi:hypothetical protein
LSYDPLRLSPSSAICENTANRAGKYLKRYEPRHPQQSPPNKPNKHPYKTNLQQPPPNKTNPQPTPTNNLQYNLSPNSILYKDIHIELGLNPVYPFNKHPHIFSYIQIPQVYENISLKSPPHDYDESIYSILREFQELLPGTEIRIRFSRISKIQKFIFQIQLSVLASCIRSSSPSM